jgi:hypothetical protein
MVVGSGTATVGSADVLLVDEELVEVGDPAHPSDAEKSWRRSRSQGRGEPGEVRERERSSSSFGQAAPRPGQDKPGAGEGVTLAQNQVCGDVAGRPRLQQRRREGTELVEQVAEPRPLDVVVEPSYDRIL